MKKILWVSWKSILNKDAGGAEVVADSILTRLAHDGFEVTLLTPLYKNKEKSLINNGYKIVRHSSNIIFFAFFNIFFIL